MADLSTRARLLTPKNSKYSGKSIVYVMSRDQRVYDNHALLLAQNEAIKNKLPLAVVFCLKKTSSKRSRHHYEWMVLGLKEVESQLKALNIPFIMLIGEPKKRLDSAFKHFEPQSVYFDFSPFRSQKSLLQNFTKLNKFAVSEVDTHNIVPVWLASDKQEFSARTLRPKINKKLSDYLIEPVKPAKHPYRWQAPFMSIDQLRSRIESELKELPSNGQTNLAQLFPPGENNATKKLNNFLKNELKNYHITRNDPTCDGLSGLSPYLHFGQISSLRVAISAHAQACQDDSLLPSVEALLEEIIVRKELSDNFCFYNQLYDAYDGLPQWAKNTLQKHTTDTRDFIYDLQKLEIAQTHDQAWNAAQKQMLKTGKMHGYMRMYWAKKVLEWSSSPQVAIQNLKYLNDFYSLDGGDPNGYVGILWSVGGLHDRPWGERPIYGTVRSMVYSGLKRKFELDVYINKWNKI